MGMRVSEERLVIALTGQSCVGKTAIARALGERLSFEVIHCGDRVKRRAVELGTTPAALPPTEHGRLDADTRERTLSGSGGLIVEGGFLEYVLHDLLDVHIVRLTCRARERWMRMAARSPG